MYVMHPTQLIIYVALTCCFLVYALVPRILTENMTPVDDICNFTYPLHCGQPFMDKDSGANETVHEVPFYINTCSSYICFTHLFQFILEHCYCLFITTTPCTCTSNQIQMPPYTLLVGLLIHIHMPMTQQRFL
jgi:hypothetical protein